MSPKRRITSSRKKFKNKEKKKGIDRIHIVAIIFFLFGSIVALRLFMLQVLHHGFYKALAEGQHDIYEKLLPERGEVWAQDTKNGKLYPLATNMDLHLVYASPRQINDPEEATKKLANVLNIDQDEILYRLSKENDGYEPIAHEVEDETWEKVEELGIEGVYSTSESVRAYPAPDHFSHILGFVGYDENEKVGRYGLEGYFNEALAGQQGFLKAERDAGGRWITVGTKMLEEASDGDDLVLTIDYNVQFYACRELAENVSKQGADKGSLIVMEPATGKILALCNYPSFDPNDYQNTEDISVFNNSAIFDLYEPGSVFKAIAMAAALDTGKVGPNSTYEDKGYVQIGSYTIKNSDEKTYGVQTMTNVLEESLNTGAIYSVQQVGNDGFYEYVKNFGFGEETGIDLAQESVGDISSLTLGKDIYSATASYGQGVAITAIELINSFAAIANGGELVKPYIVEKSIKENGFEVVTEPEVKRRVITKETSRTLSAMLVSVINKGHATRAQVPGYFVAGKTGTAQVPKKNGAGYEEKAHNDTFVGFGPVSDPRFVILVNMKQPRASQWAAGSCAPVFGEVAKYLVEYYQIPPDALEEE